MLYFLLLRLEKFFGNNKVKLCITYFLNSLKQPYKLHKGLMEAIGQKAI